MLTADKLRDLSIKKQTTVLNIRREYVQHLFLSYFYQLSTTSHVFFKGGTALHLIYGNPRFSEDLDFSSRLRHRGRIEDVLQNTLKEVEREGIEVEIEEAKETTGGYLAIIGFKVLSDKVTLQLELSYRNSDQQGEVITVVNDFIPPYTIVALKREQLIGQKIQALISRQKARDFYDLYFILRANLLHPEEKTVLTKVLQILTKEKIRFKTELEEFLPRSHSALVKDFKSTLERELRLFMA